MNSGSLMTAIAILAAVWVQASYEQRLRLRVARWQPLRTGMSVSLANTGLLAGAEYATKIGYLQADSLVATATGATGIAIGIVAWVLVCTTRTSAFNAANANAYEGLVREGINAGRLNELRVLAEALRISARRLVAYASDVRRGETWGGKKNQAACEAAVRILNQMADEHLMQAICLEGGRVITEVADEARLKWAQATGYRDCTGLYLLTQMEEQILKAVTKEAARSRCPLLRETRLEGHDGIEYTRSRHDGQTPAQTRYGGTPICWSVATGLPGH